MGVLGFFIFLSVLVIAGTWRSVKLAQIRRDMLMRVLESGQTVSYEQLALLTNAPPRLIAWAGIKIATLLLLGAGAVVLSLVYWEKGTGPVLVAGLFALVVAAATFAHARRAQRLADPPQAPGTEHE